MLTASIISIGSELLSGRTINSNAATIGKRMTRDGIHIQRVITVADDRNALTEAFRYCETDSKIIFCTGGLGPTNDDMTRQIIADYIGEELVCFEHDLARIEAIFARYGRTMTESNRFQAYYPKSATIYPNDLGTASGFKVSHDDHDFYFVPGVPYEMSHLLDEHIRHEWTDHGDTPAAMRIYRTANIPESGLYESLKPIMEQHPELEFTFYPKYLTVDVFCRSTTDALNGVAKKLDALLSKDTYSRDEHVDLMDVIHRELAGRDATLSLAESCTGGLLASMITEKPGISNVFVGGIVSYSNELKIRELGVDPLTLDRYGAVSEQCVAEMAEGARRRLQTDYAISVSGIAGPDGGTADKPVGTVCFGIAGPEGTLTKRRVIGNKRQVIQKRSAYYGFYLLWRYLENPVKMLKSTEK